MHDDRISVAYDAAAGTLRTRLAGTLTLADVHAWRDALHAAGRAVPAVAEFRALVDIRGYDVGAQDMAVHRVQREVVPRFLAAHGFVVGFFRLYEETPPPADPSLARCIAVAHVHHEAFKMERYDELLGSDTERFFTDPAEAEAWLAARPLLASRPGATVEAFVQRMGGTPLPVPGARESLPTFLHWLAEPPHLVDYAGVRVSVVEDHDGEEVCEYLWMRDVRWDGTSFRGYLDTIPDELHVRMDRPLSVSPDAMVDWMVITPGGHLCGGFGLRRQLAQMAPGDREATLRSYRIRHLPQGDDVCAPGA